MLRTLISISLPKKTQQLLFYNLSKVWIHPWRGIDFHRKRHEVNSDHYLDIVNQLKPGDVLLSRLDNFLTNAFISGESKRPMIHAAMYVGKSFDEQLQHGVVHAVHPKVRRDEFASYLDIDGLQVWRTDLLSEEDKDIVCKRAKNTYNENINYDYDFLGDMEGVSEKRAYMELYCSELVAFSYKPFMDKGLKFDIGKRFGYPTYVPDTFIRKGEGFYKVLEA